MTATPTHPLAHRFDSLIMSLLACASELVAGGCAWLFIDFALIKLFWRRLRRLNRKFARIVAAWQAGTLPPAGSPRPARARPAAPRERAPDPMRTHGWVSKTISRAFVRAWDLEEMLDDPELQTLVAEAPLAGRVLRPLCHLLAVKQPEWLRLPHRPRAPRPRKPRPKRILVRLGAGQLWRGPTPIWPTLEAAQKFDAKIWISPDELE
jgi:hypothetical protein